MRGEGEFATHLARIAGTGEIQRVHAKRPVAVMVPEGQRASEAGERQRLPEQVRQRQAAALCRQLQYQRLAIAAHPTAQLPHTRQFAHRINAQPGERQVQRLQPAGPAPAHRRISHHAARMATTQPRADGRVQPGLQRQQG